jgi:zinc transport system ATP-binding protein
VGAAVVEADDIVFAYGSEPVLDHVGLRVDAGEFVALVGPNGSGKSTLVRILVGLLQPAAGTVRLFGEPPRRPSARARVGYVPQRLRLAGNLPATVAEVVTSGRLGRRNWWRRPGAADRTAIDSAIAAVALDEQRARPVRELSGGQQQRVLIAKALAAEPELLLLDEPTAGVDAEAQLLFRDALVKGVRERGGAVVLVSHELGAVADDLDRIVVLKRRVLFDGPPDELAATGVSLGIHQQDLPLWLETLR